MFTRGRPPDARLAGILAEVHGADLTYPEVGATRRPGALPAGYHHARASALLGEGDAVFAAAVAGVRGWRLHRGQGFRVVPAEPPVEPGTEVVVDAPLPLGVHVIAACRVVWTVDEADRFGFGYGTLPVHPAAGEEAFVVERLASGAVQITVTAFSRPRHPLVRLGGPIARWQQRQATRGYVTALQAFVAGEISSGPSSG
ncbi:MAG TPA: DUF1990 domain-containing protein [Acidimicrobiales bacterium]|nr:DUF1990 domain-containing protein [Acidimicrobiales bacterium]